MWQVRTHSTCINLRAAASNVPMSRDRSGVRLHKSRRVKGTRRCSECVCFDLPGCAPRGSNRTRIALCCPFTPHFLPTATVCRTPAALWTVTEPFQGSGAICSRRVGPHLFKLRFPPVPCSSSHPFSFSSQKGTDALMLGRARSRFQASAARSTTLSRPPRPGRCRAGFGFVRHMLACDCAARAAGAFGRRMDHTCAA